MIQMPWTKETFSFSCVKYETKTTEKHFIKTVPLSFDNENWRETCQFGYGWSSSMLTLTWPHKNHWKLFDGSSIKKYSWKGNSNMYWGISKCHLLKWGSRANDLPKNSALPKSCVLFIFPWANLPVVRVIFPVHLILPLKVPTGQFCHQLHVIGLSRMYVDTYQMNFKYVLYRRGFGGVFSNSRTFSSHNIPELHIVQHKEGFTVWWN